MNPEHHEEKYQKTEDRKKFAAVFASIREIRVEPLMFAGRGADTGTPAQRRALESWSRRASSG